MVYRNDHPTQQIFIADDQFNDGQRIIQGLRNFDSTYKTSDHIRVELQGISKEVYDYYYSLQQTIHQSSATPANPINMIGGHRALGYFSAHTSQQRTAAMP